ncbi:vrrA product domain protein [Bacillus cereus ATCC 10876]|nr:vrrA product domain protein [Bacillus cereus ATCC 10876]
MFPKSPTRQMYPNPGQQPYTPYPIPQLPPMAQKRKVFLLSFLKNTIQPSLLCKWFHLTDKWKGN